MVPYDLLGAADANTDTDANPPAARCNAQGHNLLFTLLRIGFITAITLPITCQRLLADDPPKGWACVIPVTEKAIGGVHAINDLPDGAVLIGAENGLFRFDPSTKRPMPAHGAATGRVFAIHKLSDGAVLISAEDGLFRFDSTKGQVLPPDGPRIGRPNYMRELLDGGLLIGAENG